MSTVVCESSFILSLFLSLSHRFFLSLPGEPLHTHTHAKVPNMCFHSLFDRKTNSLDSFSINADDFAWISVVAFILLAKHKTHSFLQLCYIVSLATVRYFSCYASMSNVHCPSLYTMYDVSLFTILKCTIVCIRPKKENLQYKNSWWPWASSSIKNVRK